MSDWASSVLDEMYGGPAGDEDGLHLTHTSNFIHLRAIVYYQGEELSSHAHVPVGHVPDLSKGCGDWQCLTGPLLFLMRCAVDLLATKTA